MTLNSLSTCSCSTFLRKQHSGAIIITIVTVLMTALCLLFAVYTPTRIENENDNSRYLYYWLLPSMSIFTITMMWLTICIDPGYIIKLSKKNINPPLYNDNSTQHLKLLLSDQKSCGDNCDNDTINCVDDGSNNDVDDDDNDIDPLIVSLDKNVAILPQLFAVGLDDNQQWYKEVRTKYQHNHNNNNNNNNNNRTSTSNSNETVRFRWYAAS